MKLINKCSVFTYLIIALMFSFGIVYAQDDYQTEISIGYLNADDDDDNEGKLYALFVEQHFSQVNTSSHPLVEAAFLERVGSFEIAYGMTETKLGTNISADGPLYGVAVTYMQPGSPIFVELGFTKIDREFEPPVNADMTTDIYGLDIGIFIRDGFLVAVGYSHDETDLSLDGRAKESFKVDTYELNTKFINERSNGTAINIEGNIGVSQFDNPNEDGSNTIINISGDYYFNPRVSLGSEIGLNSGDDKDDEGKSFNVNVNAFINPFIAVGLGFDKFFADNTEGEDAKSFDVTLLARF